MKSKLTSGQQVYIQGGRQSSRVKQHLATSKPRYFGEDRLYLCSSSSSAEAHPHQLYPKLLPMSRCNNRCLGQQSGGGKKRNKQRNTYTCRICSEPMWSAGHTQVRGQRYCSFATGQIPREERVAHEGHYM